MTHGKRNGCDRSAPHFLFLQVVLFFVVRKAAKCHHFVKGLLARGRPLKQLAKGRSKIVAIGNCLKQEECERSRGVDAMQMSR